MTEAWTDDAADVIPGDAAADDIPGDEAAGIPDEPEAFAEEIEAQDVRPAADVPDTGDPRVDEVLAKLSGIEGQPPAEHVAVYDEVHRGLQDALADLDQG